ncbi:hypothetical protein [Halococcoides cellulosivorans]|uniref:hypothetical protein n=1 Tax=Halococcoides cellulosivorans TaxID=1679096 RepID=UPI00131F3D13|nr:hypothetical protein [Halococcoides cellulosivorans]
MQWGTALVRTIADGESDRPKMVWVDDRLVDPPPDRSSGAADLPGINFGTA